MYLYQLKFNKDDCDSGLVTLTNNKKYSQSEFQNIIKAANFEIGHFSSFSELVRKLNDYGFSEVVTGYYIEY